MYLSVFYVCAPITVGRGLWGAVADAVCLRERYYFPNRLGWGLGVQVDKRGFGLGPHPAARGGGLGTSYCGGGGGLRGIGLSEVHGGSKKVFSPMTWGALSEARRVPPQETVIRGHGGDYCACSCNTSKYNINSYNIGSYRIYIRCNHACMCLYVPVLHVYACMAGRFMYMYVHVCIVCMSMFLTQ